MGTFNLNDVASWDLIRTSPPISPPRQVLSGHGCNILSSEQHTDTASSRFFQRSAFDISTMLTDKVTLSNGISEVAKRLNMKAEITWPPLRKKVAIFVSKYEHCFWELLLRHRAGECECAGEEIGRGWRGGEGHRRSREELSENLPRVG